MSLTQSSIQLVFCGLCGGYNQQVDWHLVPYNQMIQSSIALARISHVQEEDAVGSDTIWHTENDGIRYPNFPNIDSITNMHNLPIRDDDIFICAYPKSVHYGSWFDHVLEWEDLKRTHPDLPVLALYYEDINEDPLREIKKVNEILGTGRSAEFLLEAIKLVDCFNVKQKKRPSDANRKCEVGDWKNWFTLAQNKWFDQLYQGKMADSDIKVRFTLP